VLLYIEKDFPDINIGFRMGLNMLSLLMLMPESSQNEFRM